MQFVGAMSRLRLRWAVTRLGLIVCVLLAMQFVSQLGLLTVTNQDCGQMETMFKERPKARVQLSQPDMQEADVPLQNSAPVPPRAVALEQSPLSEISQNVAHEDLKKLATDLKRLSVELTDTHRSLVSSVVQYHRVGQHIQLLNSIIKSLGADDESNSTVSSADKKLESPKKSSARQEVCPEKFMGKSLAYGYPYFRKGFERQNCSQFVPVYKLVTILIALPKELTLPEMRHVWQGIAKYYPQTLAVLATKEKLSDEQVSMISKLKIRFKSIVSKDFSQGLVWSKLLQEVDTPYVLFARDITHFTDDVNLERLLRVLSYNEEVVISGGSHRNLQGEWDIGCLQVSFKNWTAYFRGGYYRSFSECVVCDVLSGPFMAKTQRIKELGLDEKLPFGVFQDLFWRLKLKSPGEVVVSCPDVMFNVYQREIPDVNYAKLAQKWEVKKWVDSNGKVRWYGCRRGYSHTSSGSCSFHGGLGVPPCDLENLADAIKFVMKECEDAGLFCELQEGTLLGAVKFNKVLPWERDADITFLTANYTAFKKLRNKFNAAGYSLGDDDDSLWCCVDGRQAGGKFRVGTTRWTLELYGQHRMESEMLVESGQRPTKVQLAGQWVTVMRNPGLFARNRYGPNMYRHAEHWMDNGHDSGWAFYKPSSFSKCPKPGHSGCLDQFPADGNLQLSDYPLI